MQLKSKYKPGLNTGYRAACYSILLLSCVLLSYCGLYGNKFTLLLMAKNSVMMLFACFEVQLIQCENGLS